jgi:hypothetical protein
VTTRSCGAGWNAPGWRRSHPPSTSAGPSTSSPAPTKSTDDRHLGLAVGGGDGVGDQGDAACVEVAEDGAQVNGDGGVAEAGGDPQDGLLGGGAGQEPVFSRACSAPGQLMKASGWPVLMLGPAVMTLRKAGRCRKQPWLMTSPAAAVSAGMPLAASRRWQARSWTGMAVAFTVTLPGKAVLPRVPGRLAGTLPAVVRLPGHETGQRGFPGQPAGRSKASTGCGSRISGQAAREACGVRSCRAGSGRPRGRRTASGSG